MSESLVYVTKINKRKTVNSYITLLRSVCRTTNQKADKNMRTRALKSEFYKQEKSIEIWQAFDLRAKAAKSYTNNNCFVSRKPEHIKQININDFSKAPKTKHKKEKQYKQTNQTISG